MADYNWFTNEPATPSEEKLLSEEFDYAVHEVDPQANNINKYSRQMRAEKVWCNWCLCSVYPAVYAMRQHRRVCTTDPRIAGSEYEGKHKA